jgi:hypothetical protein
MCIPRGGMLLLRAVLRRVLYTTWGVQMGSVSDGFAKNPRLAGAMAAHARVTDSIVRKKSMSGSPDPCFESSDSTLCHSCPCVQGLPGRMAARRRRPSLRKASLLRESDLVSGLPGRGFAFPGGDCRMGALLSLWTCSRSMATICVAHTQRQSCPRWKVAHSPEAGGSVFRGQSFADCP